MNNLILGEIITGGLGSERSFGFDNKIRDKHIYILGKSGSGKSSIINNLVFQDIQAGRGIGLIDPHGDLIENILTLIPKKRLRDVCYVNLNDKNFAFAFNPLEKINGVSIATQADYIVNAFKHIWADSWGYRMEFILSHTISALIEAEETLLMVLPFLFEKEIRDKILRKVSDYETLKFFKHDFEKFSEKYQVEVISPIQNKLGYLVKFPSVRNVLAARKSKTSLRYIIDNQKILLINLSKGQLGDSLANLFGSLFVSLLSAAAYSRADIKPEERKPFYLYIDEFQNFATNKFASMLSEVRKYGISLCLANQYLSQIKPEIRDAVLGNVYNLLIMRSNPEDAKMFEIYLRPYPLERIYELDSYEVVYLVAGSNPVFAKTYPPYENRYSQKEKIIRASNTRFSTPISIILEKLDRFYKDIMPRRRARRRLIKQF